MPGKQDLPESLLTNNAHSLATAYARSAGILWAGVPTEPSSTIVANLGRPDFTNVNISEERIATNNQVSHGEPPTQLSMRSPNVHHQNTRPRLGYDLDDVTVEEGFQVESVLVPQADFFCSS